MESVLRELNCTDSGGVRPEFRTGTQYTRASMGKPMDGLKAEEDLHL